METTTKTSLTEFVQMSCGFYKQPAEAPKGVSESYLRQLVSGFNSRNESDFGVFAFDGKLFIATRSDGRNIKKGKHEPATIVPGSLVQFETMDANDHLKAAVELFRGEGLSGEEMREKLNSLLTDGDDLL